MELLVITLVAWTAFAAAAFLPGFFFDRLARGRGQAHA
jgi:hypothetical protein